MENKISRRVDEIAGKERISGHEFLDAKRIYLNGREAALLSLKDSSARLRGRHADGEPDSGGGKLAHGPQAAPQAIRDPAPAPARNLNSPSTRHWRLWPIA